MKKNNLDNKEFLCTGCFLCKDVCPTGAISIKKDKEGYYEYSIDEKKCIDCGLCVKKCPKLKDPKNKNYKEPKCYAAYSKNQEYIMNSSSGAIFSEIAAQFLEDNGVVIGAAYVNGSVKHIAIEKESDLWKLRSSKYIQSNLDNIYKTISKYLKDGKKVLFSGTSCHIAAVTAFITDDNLYTLDIVCHGVPSQKIFDKGIKDRYGKELKSVNFRDKSTGWGNMYSVEYSFKDGSKKKLKHLFDGWYLAYMRNHFLKKDCYDCKFTKFPREADITLGDFWGIYEMDREMSIQNEDKGISMVLLNNTRGKKMFDDIKSNIIFKEQSLELAVKYQPRICKGKYNDSELEKREAFFKNYDTYKFKNVSNKIVLYRNTLSFLAKVKGKIKKVLKWLGLR